MAGAGVERKPQSLHSLALTPTGRALQQMTPGCVQSGEAHWTSLYAR